MPLDYQPDRIYGNFGECNTREFVSEQTGLIYRRSIYIFTI